MPDQAFVHLQQLCAQPGTAAPDDILRLLQSCMQHRSFSTKTVTVYHNNLLFLIAYAQNKAVRSAALAALEQLCETIRTSPGLGEKLLNTGIAYTPTQSAFSLSLTTWLVNCFPDQLRFHSFDDGGVHPKEMLRPYLDEMEYELAAEEKLRPGPWLKKACGSSDKSIMLRWLMNAVNALPADHTIKDQLFESLKLFVEIKPGGKMFSRSFGRINFNEHYYHSTGFLKKFDEREIIHKPLPREKKLSDIEKRELIGVSRIALILLQRETDPVTYSKEAQLKFYELERGLSIVFFSIDTERRLPLESYIGFMMFKNGYPMSYGGAWLFAKRALIGINIFEPYRGGESAMVFAQLLRCYKNAFGAEYFEVEPYQFGKNNPDGIRSGAFWFYYRFGFRPADQALRVLAEAEALAIRSRPGYRSTPATLRRFTTSNLFVNFGDSAPLSPSDLSRYLTWLINSNYGGDRQKAQRAAASILRKNGMAEGSRPGPLKKTGLFMVFCLDLSSIPLLQKRALGRMMQLKCNDEFAYIARSGVFPFEKYMAPGFHDYVKSYKYPILR